MSKAFEKFSIALLRPFVVLCRNFVGDRSLLSEVDFRKSPRAETMIK